MPLTKLMLLVFILSTHIHNSSLGGLKDPSFFKLQRQMMINDIIKVFHLQIIIIIIGVNSNYQLLY